MLNRELANFEFRKGRLTQFCQAASVLKSNEFNYLLSVLLVALFG